MALAHWTAWGAAIAFELATGVFTFRIVKGTRRRWTRYGLWFFIVASAVANATYYGWLPVVFDTIMPVFATIALPFALFLFAEEFGAEVKLAERRAKREERKAEPKPAYSCRICGQGFEKQQALAGHMKAHNGRSDNGKGDDKLLLSTMRAHHVEP